MFMPVDLRFTIQQAIDAVAVGVLAAFTILNDSHFFQTCACIAFDKTYEIMQNTWKCETSQKTTTHKVCTFHSHSDQTHRHEHSKKSQRQRVCVRETEYIKSG